MENELEVQRSLGRIEGGIAEIKTDIKLMRDDHSKLRQEFSTLEAGRLTKLESAFASLQADIHSRAKTIATWTSTIIAISISVISQLIVYFLLKK